MNTDVKQMDIKELKSIAYDILASMENLQNNLKVVNGEIAERNKQPNPPLQIEAPKEVVEEVKKEE